MSQRDDRHESRVRISHAAWLRHRSILEAYRVAPGDHRTTPPPAYDVSQLFPELADRSKTTVRLHPRYGAEPPVDASKLGGTLLWPAEEPWPVCPVHDVPMVAVLQLRASDFPEMPFRPGSDLFQILWCPREHPGQWPMVWVDPRFFWRDRQAITRPRDNPPPQEAYYEYVPLPCRLLPERVLEYPSVYEFPDELVQRIYDWENTNLGDDGMHACEYEGELSVAFGTKIGGYLRPIQFPHVPSCQCGRPMEHLLTISSVEWNGVGDRRWTPVEEQSILASFSAGYDAWDEDQRAVFDALWNPTGLVLGDGGHMQLFVCRHCPDWPVIPSIECS